MGFPWFSGPFILGHLWGQLISSPWLVFVRPIVLLSGAVVAKAVGALFLGAYG
jgi:hypothetical protein